MNLYSLFIFYIHLHLGLYFNDKQNIIHDVTIMKNIQLKNILYINK